MEGKADLDKATTDDGATPLCIAAQKAHEAIVRYGQWEITNLIISD